MERMSVITPDVSLVLTALRIGYTSSPGTQYVRTTTTLKMYQFLLNMNGHRYSQVSILS